MSMFKEKSITVLNTSYADIKQPYTVPPIIIIVPPNTSRLSVVLKTLIVDETKPQTFTIGVNTTNANMGDQLVLFFSFSAPNYSYTINLSSDFYYTECGRAISTFLNSGSGLQYKSSTFVYNGEKYINTDDSC